MLQDLLKEDARCATVVGPITVKTAVAGQPYRKSKPEEFRGIHYLMAEAVRQDQTIVLTLLRNVSPGENINDAEQKLRQDMARCSTGC